MEDRHAFWGANWRSSGACNGGHCVEVAFSKDLVAVRDGKKGDEGPVLAFGLDEWESFITDVKAGRFDH
ncbi:DUF397 domain-containing protein [Streptosporangium sp. KLBMP 9127]|nr:DUF397 domain-containing protein [Streptosporangium sp. KLBMP 9127]